MLCAGLVLASLGAAPDVVSDALAFIGTLEPSKRTRAVLDSDSEGRFDWHYVPKARLGISWGDLDSAQSQAAERLLRSSLSQTGYTRIGQIRDLEDVLFQLEKNPGRDRKRYFFVFFGEPSKSSPWMWRYEGHHLSLSFAYKGTKLVASTPQFLGTNPAKSPTGGEPLKATRDLGFELLNSLTPEQRRLAVVSNSAPFDIATTNSRVARIEGRQGLPVVQMTAEQRRRLAALVATHAEVQTGAESARRMAAYRAESPETIAFCWMGATTPDSHHYYRIQGEDMLIEYDSTQPNGNHIHTVWRSLKEDFGADPLANHHANHRH